MACFSGVIRSSVLAMDTGLTVILPYDRPAEPQKTPCKVLYLLHGMGENCSAWLRYTRLESYAREKGIAVVMPEVQRSFYYDMAYGMNYFTYVAVELPELCEQMFQISPKREDHYVAGLSMGGYGALKCAMVRPEYYCGAASFSGAIDIVALIDQKRETENNRLTEEFRATIGMDLQILPQDDLFYLAGQIAQNPAEKRPDIFITCGTEDFLYDFNRSFRTKLASLEFPFTYREWPGEHNWEFWDRSLQILLEHWFPEP